MPEGSLEYALEQRARLQRRLDALPLGALPKDVAALDAGIARHSRIIAELRGEVKLTAKKIASSEAWQTFWAPISRLLRDEHPDALEAVNAHLKSVLDGKTEES